MQAVRLHGPGDLRFDEVPALPEPGPDQVIVQPTWCGLCGTDMKYYLGKHPSRPGEPDPYPFVMGHEFSARVVALGRDVHGVSSGDRVAVLPLRHCGKCAECWEGRFHHCRSKQWTGLGAASGGLCDLTLLEAYQATRINGLSEQQAALVEPAAVALNAVTAAGVEAGDSVLIAGAGPIGMLALFASTVAGASAVYVLETNPARAKRVADMGGIPVSGELEGWLEQLMAATHGRGVDIAIDCAGVEAALASCFAAVRPGGVVAVPSVHREAPRVDVLQITRKSVALVGSIGYSRSVWRRTIDLIAGGRLPVERVVTSRIPRPDVLSAGLEVLSAPQQSELKILVRVLQE